MLKRIALLLVFTAAFNLRASEAPEHWLEVRSPNFIVVSNASEKQARHIADQMERMRSICDTLFPGSSADMGAPIVAIAVKDKKSLQTLEPEAYLAKGQVDLAGLFLTAPDKSYILLRLDAGGDHPYATIYHEYTHFRVRRDSAWLPLWINEGYAEFFQNTEIENKIALLGEPSLVDIQILRQNPILPLTTLFKVDHNSPYYHDEQKGSIFYSESWALIHYLQHKDFETNTHQLNDYIQLVSQNVDAVTAAQRAFGDLNRLQEALQSYVSQGHFFEFKAPIPTTVDETTFKVRELTLPQANAVRADFLAYDQRRKDAHALLDSILHDDPDNLQAQETMGYLSLSEGDHQAARNWYARAVKLGSESYLTQYYFAAMSMNGSRLSAEDAATVEASLRSAIQLNPSFAPSYDTLATLYGEQHEKLDEAHMLNLKAISLDPGNVRYRLNTASILVEMNNQTDALRVLQQALATAKTESDRAAVESRLQSIERFQQAAPEQAHAIQSGAQQPSTPAQVVIVEKVEAKGASHPDETPQGPTRVATGTLQNVSCSYPSVLELKIVGAAKTLSLYSNNYVKVDFSAANFTPKGDLDPCHDLNGLKARVAYAETSDKREDGQIVSVILSK